VEKRVSRIAKFRRRNPVKALVFFLIGVIVGLTMLFLFNRLVAMSIITPSGEVYLGGLRVRYLAVGSAFVIAGLLAWRSSNVLGSFLAGVGASLLVDEVLTGGLI
jgi:hypothetical protein